MSHNYFKKLITIGANIDERISKLEENWKIPNLILYKENEQDQTNVKKFIQNIRNEIDVLKESIIDDKKEIEDLKEANKQVHLESTSTFEEIKEQINQYKILFKEFGYEEEIAENDDFNKSNEILEKSLKEKNIEETKTFTKNSIDNSSFLENSLNFNSPVNKCLGILKKPQEPNYSPSFYRVLRNK